MNASQIIELAKSNIGGTMVSSAQLCINDAVSLLNAGNETAAKARALKSLAYSVGILSPVYRQACNCHPVRNVHAVFCPMSER